MKKLLITMIIFINMTCTACGAEYLDGEELFYNDVYNHGNVDLVYDAEYVKNYRATQAATQKTKKKAKKTNKQLVRSYCKKHYPGRKIKYAKHFSDKVLTHRKNSGKVLVLIVKSKSRGRYGYDKDGYYIRYNKKVKRGKTVTSYLIYNAKTNYIDDIAAVVDNRKIR